MISGYLQACEILLFTVDPFKKVTSFFIQKEKGTLLQPVFEFNGIEIYDVLPAVWRADLAIIFSQAGEQQKPNQSLLTFDQNLFAVKATLVENDRIVLNLNRSNASSIDFLNIQHQLALKLAASTNLELLMAASLEACFVSTGMDSGGVYLRNFENDTLELKYALNLSKPFINAAKSYASDDDRWKLVMKGLPVYIEFDKLPGNTNQNIEQESLKSAAVLPLVYQGRVIGSINVASRSIMDVSADTRSILETITIQIGPAVDRLQQRERLLSRSLRFREILDGIDDFLIIVGTDGNILFVNQQLLDQLNFDSNELIQKPLAILFHSEQMEEINRKLFNYDHENYLLKNIKILKRNGEPVKSDLWISMTSWALQPAYLIWGRNALDQGGSPILDGVVNSLTFYEDLPVPVLILEPVSMTVLYANHLACSQYGFSPAETTKQNYLQFFFTKDLQFIARTLRENRFAEINQLVWDQRNIQGEAFKIRLSIRSTHFQRKHVYIVVANKFALFETEHSSENQNRLQSVLDQQTDIILRFSDGGLITYANQAYLDFFGQTFGETIGASVTKNVYAADFDILTDHLGKLSSENPIRESKNRMVDGQGRVRWVAWIDRAIYQDEKLVEIQAVGRDITDEEEQTIRDINLNQQFYTMVENIPAIVYLLQLPSLFPIYINTFLEQRFGYSKEELWETRDLWKKIIHKDDYALWFKEMESRRSGEAVNTIEFRAYTKSGEIVWVTDQGRIINHEQQGRFLEGVVTEITALKEVETRLLYYRKFDKVIQKILSELMEADPEFLPEKIQTAIITISNFLKIDRCYIFYKNEDGSVSNRYEWNAEGIPNQKEQLQNLPDHFFPYYYHCIFHKKESVIVHDINDLGEEAKMEAQFFKARYVQSQLVIPMIKHGQVIGFMGFDMLFKKHTWSVETISLLQVVSNLIVFVDPV